MPTQLSSWSVDLKQAFRTVWKRPGFSLLVVSVLGLGIGGATTIFSLTYAVLLRPLPLPEPDRLVEIRTVSTRPEADVFGASDQDAADWGKRSPAIETIGTYSTGRLNLLPGGRAVSVAIAHVTPDLFSALGVTPMIGRTFLPEEDVPGGDASKAVLSYSTWQSLYGGRSDVLGEELRTGPWQLRDRRGGPARAHLSPRDPGVDAGPVDLRPARHGSQRSFTP